VGCCWGWFYCFFVGFIGFEISGCVMIIDKKFAKIILLMYTVVGIMLSMVFSVGAECYSNFILIVSLFGILFDVVLEML